MAERARAKMESGEIDGKCVLFLDHIMREFANGRDDWSPLECEMAIQYLVEIVVGKENMEHIDFNNFAWSLIGENGHNLIHFIGSRLNVFLKANFDRMRLQLEYDSFSDENSVRDVMSDGEEEFLIQPWQSTERHYQYESTQTLRMKVDALNEELKRSKEENEAHALVEKAFESILAKMQKQMVSIMEGNKSLKEEAENVDDLMRTIGNMSSEIAELKRGSKVQKEYEQKLEDHIQELESTISKMEWMSLASPPRTSSMMLMEGIEISMENVESLKSLNRVMMVKRLNVQQALENSSHYQGKLDSVLEKNQLLQTNNVTLMRSKAKLNKMVKKLKQEMKEQTQQIERLQTVGASVQSRLSAASKSRDSLATQNEKLKEQIKKMKKLQIRNSNALRPVLLSSKSGTPVNGRKSWCEMVGGKKRNTEEGAKRSHSEEEKLKEELRERIQIESALSQEAAILKVELDSFRGRLKGSNHALASMQATVDALMEERDALREELESSAAMKKEQEQKQQIERLQSIGATLQSRLSVACKSHKKLKKQIENLKREKVQIRNSKKQSPVLLTPKAVTPGNERKSWSRMVGAKQRNPEEERLKKELMERIRRESALSQEAATLEEELDSLRGQLKGSNQALSSMQTQVDALMAERDALMVELESSAAMNKEVVDKMTLAQLGQLKRESMETQKSNDVSLNFMRAKNDELRARQIALEERMKLYQMEPDQLQQAFNALMHQNEELKLCIKKQSRSFGVEGIEKQSW